MAATTGLTRDRVHGTRVGFAVVLLAPWLVSAPRADRFRLSLLHVDAGWANLAWIGLVCGLVAAVGTGTLLLGSPRWEETGAGVVRGSLIAFGCYVLALCIAFAPLSD